MAALPLYKTLARMLVAAAILAPLLSCGERLPTGNVARISLTVVSANPQTGPVGSTLPPLIVQVLRPNGQPALGQIVNFVVTTGGGSVYAPTGIILNSKGYAQDVWTLGPVAGVQTVEARAVDSLGNKLAFGTFTATATTLAASLIGVQAGNGQTAVAGSPLSTTPAVLVTDRFGNPIPNVTVTFAVTGGGSVANQSQATGSNGIASAGVWTLGTLAGSNTLTAMSAGLTGSPVTFTATGINAAANQLIPATSTAFSGAVASTIAAATGPAVRVLDKNNNGVPNVAV